jgi:hypothetical protein
MIVAGDAGSAPRSLPGTTVILASDNPKAPTAPAPPDHRPNAFPELMGELLVQLMGVHTLTLSAVSHTAILRVLSRCTCEVYYTIQVHSDGVND